MVELAGCPGAGGRGYTAGPLDIKEVELGLGQDQLEMILDTGVPWLIAVTPFKIVSLSSSHCRLPFAPIPWLGQ